MDIRSEFESIRDIPYKIPLTLKDKSIDCDKKHKLLADMLTKENYQVRFRVCAFMWNQQALPQEVLAIPHEDKCEHLYLEVFREYSWQVLDITWDERLQNVFPICEWDAANNPVAIIPTEIYPQEYDRPLIHNETEETFLEDINTSGVFYKAFNEWLEQQRT